MLRAHACTVAAEHCASDSDSEAEERADRGTSQPALQKSPEAHLQRPAT